MDSFALLDNAYIKNLNDKASGYTEDMSDRNLKNTLKITKQIQGKLQNTASVANTIYGQEYTFDFDNLSSFNGLSDMFIKINNLTYSHTFDAPITDFADTLIESVTIRTKSGTTLMNYNYYHAKKRIEEATGLPLKDYYDDCIKVLSDGDTFCYMPIFSWFNSKNPLDLRYAEPIEVKIRIADLSGLYTNTLAEAIDVTGANFTLICVFHDYIEQNKPSLYDGPIVKYEAPERQLNSYDIFSEPVKTYTVVNGASGQVTMKLTCPYPSYVMHICAMSDKRTYWPVTGIEMAVNNVKFLDMDPNINFAIGNHEEYGFIEYNTYSHWFSKCQCRESVTGLLEFGDSFTNTYLTIDLDENTSGSSVNLSVYVWFEYRTDIKLKNKEFIKSPNGLFKGPFAGPSLL